MNVIKEIRYALRLLARSPAFTVIAVLTLALGIGVNSGIFTVVDAVMLRPLPYPEPDRLLSLWETAVARPSVMNSSGASVGGAIQPLRWTVSAANLVDYRKENHVFTGMAGFGVAGMNLTETGPPERIWGERVTSEYFSVLGIQPAQGRAFLPEEDRLGNNRVVIVTHDLWQRLFGSDSNLIGSSLTLDSEKYRVIGILQPGFESPSQFGMTDRLSFFVPAAYPAAQLAQHGDHDINVLARLRPGVSLDQARAEMDAISSRLAQTYPDTNRNVKTGMAPLADDIARNVRTSMLVLVGAVGLILLIACANLANLLLVRAAGRHREITIRFALGASRRRIIRELLIQSTVLASIGCAAGLVFGIWTRQFLVRLAPSNIPRLAEAGMNGHVLFFTVLLSLMTGILFGLFPAWQVSKARPAESLKSSERNLAGTAVMRWRSALMVAEIAVSMVLLVGAGLLLRSFITLNGVDLGFATERVMAMNINLPETRYQTQDRRFAFFDELASRVANLPGVQAVGFANRFPMRGGWGGSFQLDTDANPGNSLDSDFQAVNPGYFQTLGIPLTRGRLLTPADRSGAQPVAVVNTEFVHRYLKSENPMSHRFRRGPQAPWITIVGVVGDVHRGGKAAPITPQVYLAAAQTSLYPVRVADFAFRAAGDPKSLIAAVQQQVWAIDKDQPVTNVKTLEEVISQAAAERRFQTLLLLLFAGLALALALVGVYGVISYSVSQRTGEIGLRIALGAARADILRLVIGRAILMVIAGIVLGAAGAYGLSRYLVSLLFEIKPTDPATYGSLAFLLVMVALLACYVPARRATKVDPMVALRYE